MLAQATRSRRKVVPPSRFWRSVFQENVDKALQRLEEDLLLPPSERVYSDNAKELFSAAVRAELATRDAGGVHRSVALPLRANSSLVAPTVVKKRVSRASSLTYLADPEEMKDRRRAASATASSTAAPPAAVRSTLSKFVKRSVLGPRRDKSRAGGSRRPERRGNSRSAGF